MDYSLAPLGSGPPVQPELDLSNLIAAIPFYQLILLKLASIVKPFFCGAFKSTAITTVRPYVAPLLHSSPSLASAVGGIVSSCTTFCHLDIANSTSASLPSGPAPRLTPYSAEEIYDMGFMASGSGGLFWQTPASYVDPAWLEDTSIPPVTEYISYVILPFPDFVDPYCQQLSSACRFLSNASGNRIAAEGELVAPVDTVADTETPGLAQALIRAVYAAALRYLSVASALASGWSTWVWTCLSETWAAIAHGSIRAYELFIRFCSCEWIVDALLPVHYSLCRAGLRLHSAYSTLLQASIRGFQTLNRLCTLDWLMPDYILARRWPTWDESLLAKPDGTTWRWVRDGLWSGMIWLSIGYAKWVLTVIGMFWFFKISWLYILKHFDREIASDSSTDAAPVSPRLHAFILSFEALSVRPVLYWFCLSPLHFLVWLLLCAGGWQTGASSLVPASDDALTNSADGTDANLTEKDTDLGDSKRASSSGTCRFIGSLFSKYRDSPPVVMFEWEESELSGSSLFGATVDDEDYNPMPEVQDARVGAVATALDTLRAYRASPVKAPVNCFYFGLTAIWTGTKSVRIDPSPFAKSTRRPAPNLWTVANTAITTVHTANVTANNTTTDNARVANLNANDTADITGAAHANADDEKHASGEKVNLVAANPQTPASDVVATDAHDKNANTYRAGATTEEKDDEAKAVSEEEKRVSRYSFAFEDLVDSATSLWVPAMPRDEGVVCAGVVGATEVGVAGVTADTSVLKSAATEPVRLAIMPAPAVNTPVNTEVQATANEMAKARVSGALEADTQAVTTGVKPAQAAEVKTVKTVGGSGYSFTANTLSGATMSLTADTPRVERIVRPSASSAANQPTPEQQVKELDNKIEELLRTHAHDKDLPEIRKYLGMINAGIATSLSQAKKSAAAVASAPAEAENPEPKTGKKAKKAKKAKKNKKKKVSGGVAPTGGHEVVLDREEDEVEEMLEQ
ncbi:hypothetical protein IAT38_002266 [Cryptococcus sp. DSM 104549]